MVHLVPWLPIIAAACVAAGFIYQALGTRQDARRFPAPGRLVNIGTHQLHLLEQGQGNVTVVLEAGLMSTVLSWSNLQQRLAESHRVVSYDRAGMGWSNSGPLPRTADRIVEELHTLLQRAGIAPPYVLVGHSFGGLTMPLFAARFPDETAGVVLVDPVAPAEWNPPTPHDLKQTRIGAAVCRRAGLLARLGLLRFVSFLLSTRVKKVAAYLVRLISQGAPSNAGSVSSPWFAALPAKEREMAAVFWVQAKFAHTMASQLENLPTSAAQVAATNRSLKMPVVILSARTAPQKRCEEHAAMAARLPLGTHILAEGSGHWVMQDQPELVLGAINSMVQRAQIARTNNAAFTAVSGNR